MTKLSVQSFAVSTLGRIVSISEGDVPPSVVLRIQFEQAEPITWTSSQLKDWMVVGTRVQAILASPL